MKPAPFKYYAPNTIDEAVELLQQHGFDAKVLAGGQSLVPTMNFRLAQPSVLVDLNRIEELFYIREGSDHLELGAMTRQRDVEKSPLIAEHAPLLHETMPFIAHPQIRNRGTIGGSIAHADPAAELPAISLVLDATFHIRNQQETRSVRAHDFFVGLFETALQPEDLLVSIDIPFLPPRSGWAFHEVARRHGDYALVGVGALITLDEAGKCSKARIALLSVGGEPMAAHQAAAALEGQEITANAIVNAAEITATQDIDPGSDIHASATYRRHLARVLTKQVLTTAWERAKKRL